MGIINHGIMMEINGITKLVGIHDGIYPLVNVYQRVSCLISGWILWFNYGRYIYTIPMVYQPTNITGGHSTLCRNPGDGRNPVEIPIDNHSLFQVSGYKVVPPS